LRVAIVELTADGTHLRQRVDNVRGTPENPMTRDEPSPARDLITRILSAEKCSALPLKISISKTYSTFARCGPCSNDHDAMPLQATGDPS
jgi:hypothetical protein